MSDEILELAVDKFLLRFPADLFYSDAGIWARFEGGKVRIGLSDFTQLRNGDVTFVEMRAEGTEVQAGDEIGVIETIKVNLSVPSPVGGTVVEVNPALESSPELVNQDAYGKGWLVVIEVADIDTSRRGLKSAADHLHAVRSQAEAEIIR